MFEQDVEGEFYYPELLGSNNKYQQISFHDQSKKTRQTKALKLNSKPKTYENIVT